MGVLPLRIDETIACPMDMRVELGCWPSNPWYEGMASNVRADPYVVTGARSNDRMLVVVCGASNSGLIGKIGSKSFQNLG